jgi:hypothetical protein
MGSDKMGLGYSTPPANKKNPIDPKKNPVTNQNNGIGHSGKPPEDKKNSKITILSSSFSLPRETPLLSNLHKFSIPHHLCPFQAWELRGKL